MGHPRHLLNVQYRMHPSISLFPNSKFYFSQILDGPNVTSLNYQKNYLFKSMFGPYSFINIGYGREEKDDIGHSRKNMLEVAVASKIVQRLYKGLSTSLSCNFYHVFLFFFSIEFCLKYDRAFQVSFSSNCFMLHCCYNSSLL